jgi:tetratricopeptide (TPR) repeat protein
LKLKSLCSLILLTSFFPSMSMAAPVQKGGVEVNRSQSSFRLQRNEPAPAPPQVTQPPEELKSVMSPDLVNQFATPVAPLAPVAPSSSSLQAGTAKFDNSDNAPRSTTVWRPGVILTGSTGQDALTPFCDLAQAAQQAKQYPTSPEAAFIYAVALTRTSQVEQALKEVRRARNLAQATGDPDYFNRAVGQYELTLQDEPNNNCIRYGLGWGYYMQAYLFATKARNKVNLENRMAGIMPKKQSKTTAGLLGGAAILASALTGTRPVASAIPRIPGALDDVPPWAEPQIRMYYQKCLNQLGELIKRDPKDAWAAAYRAHVQEEFDGDHDAAIARLAALKKTSPQNPAVAFFLADAYARNGNYGAGLSSFGDALKIRASGK